MTTSQHAAAAAAHSVDPDRWKAEFSAVLDRIGSRFARYEPLRHAGELMAGMVSGLDRKNCWTIAEHRGESTPDGLQHLLSRAKWDADGVRDDLRDYVVDAFGDPGAILVVDETGFAASVSAGGDLGGGGGLESGKSLHGNDFHATAPRLWALGQPGLECSFAASLDHVEQPCRAGLGVDRGQVDDHGDVLVTAAGMAPHVFIDADDPDPVEAGGILDQDPPAFGEHRIVHDTASDSATRAPLNRIWTQFAESKKPAVSPKTWSGYTQHWQLRVAPEFGHVPVDEITRSDVKTFVDGLTVGPLAKVSTLRLLRSILDVAHQDGRIHRNPALGVSAGRIPEREGHRYLTTQEVQTLASACGDQGDVVTLLAYTGLRWSELVGLRVKDVDLTARRLYVRRAAPEVEGRIVIGPPKTRAGIRTVPLPQVVVDIFRARITGRAPDDPAVTSPNGGML